jgi:hypothetical protein
MLLGLPGAASAQDHSFHGLVGIGPTTTFGSAADALHNGFNFVFGGAYSINPNLALRVDALATRHNVKSSITNQLGVGNGDVWMWDFDGNAVLSTHPHGIASFYGIGGIGIYYRSLTLSNANGGTVQPVCDPWLLICANSPFSSNALVGTRSSTNFGVNIGAGVNLQVSQRQVLFVECRYHYVWGPSLSAQNGEPAINAHTEILPITIGVRF